MGTPDFSVPALRNLATNRRIEVVCVYTQPPRPKGRGQSVQLSPVHQAAQEIGIGVHTPENFKNEQAIQDFENLNLDVAIVAAYGLILPKNILDAPKYGCINIHASLLPRWRGAAPIQRAILAGDTGTGITIMQMGAGLDTGPMIVKKSVAIRPKTTAQSLHDELSALGSAMIEDVLEELLEKGSLNPVPQPDEGTTYAHRLKKEEGKIDWSQTAVEIDRQIRALNPWPGTWTNTSDGKRLKILEVEIGDAVLKESPGTLLDKQGVVACGGGTFLRLLTVQPESKKPMNILAAINGGFIKSGERLA